jgi:hypothetical protein
MLQADAAARLAWVRYEMALYDQAGTWATKSVHLLEQHVGKPLGEILQSLQHGSRSALISMGDRVSAVLSLALHIKTKAMIERVLYYDVPDPILASRDALAQSDQSIQLDEYLQLRGQLGHDMLWQAALLVAGIEPRREQSESLLTRSSGNFARGSLGEAYLARDWGIVCWRTDRLRRAQDSLWKAAYQLCDFADARALGPTFYILNKAVLEGPAATAKNCRDALRYALAGAALHPYGFVLKGGLERVQDSNTTSEDLRRSIEELRSGKKPFDLVHRVIRMLARDSGMGAEKLIERNLAPVLKIATSRY